MTEQEQKNVSKKSLKWAAFWIILGVLYALNPIDVPGPIDDLIVAALAAYKSGKNIF